MALGAISLPHNREFFSPARRALLSSLKIRAPTNRPVHGRKLDQGDVKIVYIDRQDTDRRLSDEAHKDLMAVLDDLEDDDHRWKVDFVRGKFGDLDIREQIKAVADADVSLYAV